MPHTLELYGRLHPFLLHVPIGLLVACVVLEVLRASGRVGPGVVRLFLWLAALSAIVTASSGWVLGHEAGYGGKTLELHERLGIAVASLTTLSALCALRAERSSALATLQRVFLGAAVVVLLPAGHQGSTLTHGKDWLAGPRESPEVPAEPAVPEVDAPQVDATASPAPSADQPSTYASAVAPIFAARCGACHGESKQKGGLRLTTPEGIRAGSEDGPVLVAGDPAASAILVRTHLPLEHEDHMPPEGKPQPAPAELALLEAWIRAGAPFEGQVELGVPVPSPEPASGSQPATDDAPRTGALPDRAALDALAAALVHVQPIGADGTLLWIDFAAVAPSIDDAAFQRLVEPLRGCVADLSLARCGVSDAALALVARCPALERLDLRSTRVGDAGLAALAGHARLAELVLADTPLTDASVESLLALPLLQRVYVWKSGVSAAAIARLREARPALEVVGDDPPESPLESEGELVFTSDRPLPDGAAAPAVTPSLEPVNATCPVSGEPVKSGFAVVYEGRVIGFCCAKCPSAFLENPAAYAAKLP
jgi:YHS domain-containing protein/mono/diheme cytochrome c family protein/uncharacterized membrane protein